MRYAKIYRGNKVLSSKSVNTANGPLGHLAWLVFCLHTFFCKSRLATFKRVALHGPLLIHEITAMDSQPTKFWQCISSLLMRTTSENAPGNEAGYLTFLGTYGLKIGQTSFDISTFLLLLQRTFLHFGPRINKTVWILHNTRDAFSFSINWICVCFQLKMIQLKMKMFYFQFSTLFLQVTPEVHLRYDICGNSA